MKLKRFIRSSTDGLTLVELLVALAISALIIAVVLPIILSQQRLVRVDQSRTAVFQNLRSAMEIVGTDVRIAGERLEQRGGANVFPIEIISGGSDGPDELVLRRNLLDHTLPVCEDIKEGSSEHNIKFNRKGNVPPWNDYPACQTDSNDNEDINEWTDYLESQGGSARAYIYNPNNKEGEFFTLEDIDESQFQLHRTDDNGTWEHNYGVTNEKDSPPQDLPGFYVLEERRYRLDTDKNVLELIINENEEETMRVVGNIVDFQVRAVLDDDEETELQEISTLNEWKNLKAIQITLESRANVQEEVVSRQLESQFFPRNVLSDR